MSEWHKCGKKLLNLLKQVEINKLCEEKNWLIEISTKHPDQDSVGLFTQIINYFFIFHRIKII